MVTVLRTKLMLTKENTKACLITTKQLLMIPKTFVKNILRIDKPKV